MDPRRQGTVLPGPKPFDLGAGFVERATQRAETRVLQVFDDGDTHHTYLANERRSRTATLPDRDGLREVEPISS